jgi:hypothetical protein
MRLYTLILFSLVSARSFAQNEVIYIWSGAVTENSVKVNAKMTDTSSTIRLVLSQDSLFTSPIFSSYFTLDTSTNEMVSMEASGLSPVTKYYYCVESGGIMDSSADDIGSFRTFKNGPFSFSFVTGSCALNSDHPVYTKMKELHPDLYVMMGDLHYANPNSATNIYVHRSPYENQVLSKPAAAAFFKEVPIAYVWDDHDFCGNGSDSSFTGKENARQAYNEYVPHYPLGLGEGPAHPVCQAFTVGRLRFILTDLRSERSYESMLGTDQRTWYESELQYAHDNNLMVAWFSSTTWNNVSSISDNWGDPAYVLERRELADMFYMLPITNMFIVSGDAHMVGIDDGTNGDFGTEVSIYRYPLFAAGAVNQDGSYKGGTYNQGGYFLNPDYTWGQFGRVIVDDDGGDSICVTFEGYRVDASGTNFTQLDSFSFCRIVTHVGITEQDPDISVSLFPNPSGSFTIRTGKDNKISGLSVYTLRGECLSEENFEQPVELWTKKSSGLPGSMYVIEIRTEKGTVRKRWLKTD